MPKHAQAALRTSAMDTITLAQLNEEADLLTRIDRKYLIPSSEAQGLLDILAPRSQVLQIGALQSFSYASTYFDTPGLGTYMLAARKRRRRFKVRTRTYLDSALCFLEVKTVGTRESTIKTRLPYDPKDANRLTNSGSSFVAMRLTESSIAGTADAAAFTNALTPVLANNYDRITLHLPDDAARVTVDTHLTWRILGSGARPPACVKDYVVIETKNPSTPSLADRYLWSLGYRPAGLSKYATGMALLTPGLPTNKWHRLLTRQLADAGPAPYTARHAA
ncbi:polyphosphate polymerase domain-containing protein [Actinomyces slackii]|uniref:VTC domain n=1 Tax=Actinomyces slackii TaxID=52774 RepID=A0A3S4SN63_9ACTO|nr:polyphosphate polymerase domain-containing protein [Actinomyces slackii]VEG73892.1 VTC domain [Actinomyces slackii]